MKILVQRPTQISAVATVLIIIKTFTVKYYERERDWLAGLLLVSSSVLWCHGFPWDNSFKA